MVLERRKLHMTETWRLNAAGDSRLNLLAVKDVIGTAVNA